MSRPRPSALRAVVAIALAASTLGHGRLAAAQEPAEDLPAVTATPVDENAPNGGQWFVADGAPGDDLEIEVQLFNAADVEQSVRLFLSELRVGDDGDVQLGEQGRGVGAWGAFDATARQVAPRTVERATARLTIPADADPGDHLGAIVVESTPVRTTGIQVVKRVAKRLYVTVPGDADPGVEIASADVSLVGGLLPRRAEVVVVVRNTGNVRLDTTVMIDGAVAEGSKLVMSSSAERYRIERPVPVWGGRRTFSIDVATRTSTGAGPSAEDTVRAWAIPWWVLLALFLLVVGVLTLRELKRRLD